MKLKGNSLLPDTSLGLKKSFLYEAMCLPHVYLYVNKL